MLKIVDKHAYHVDLVTADLWFVEGKPIEREPWTRAINFLEAMRLVQITGRRAGESTDDWKDGDFGAVELTELGHDALKLGLRAYLEQRHAREEMQHRANRATARGYRINIWGIVFLITGLVVSGLNLYIFYRQVFDPPSVASSAQVKADAQKSGDDAKDIQHPSATPNDSLLGGPQVGSWEEAVEVPDTCKN